MPEIGLGRGKEFGCVYEGTRTGGIVRVENFLFLIFIQFKIEM